MGSGAGAGASAVGRGAGNGTLSGKRGFRAVPDATRARPTATLGAVVFPSAMRSEVRPPLGGDVGSVRRRGGIRSRSTRGSPTSFASGGGAGGFRSEGSNWSATRAAAAIAAAFPTACHRIRIPPMPAQGPNPPHFSPRSCRASGHPTPIRACADRCVRGSAVGRLQADSRLCGRPCQAAEPFAYLFLTRLVTPWSIATPSWALPSR